VIVPVAIVRASLTDLAVNRPQEELVIF
jgi:hypothetical protein